MRYSDTLLVCSFEYRTGITFAYWLVALSRRKGEVEWHEVHRLQTKLLPTLSCELNDSRMLIGRFCSDYVELFRVQSGPRIARVHRIRVPEVYRCFSATCDNNGDTHVAMSYADDSVRVFRLVGDRLDEMARIRLEKPHLWVAARLLISAPGGTGVVETRAERRATCRAQLIAGTGDFRVDRWCTLHDGLVVSNNDSKELLNYSLT